MVLAYQECRRDEVNMTEEQRSAPDRPTAERYHAEYIQLSAANEGSEAVSLREVITEGRRQDWRLISLTKEPGDSGFFLVWDTSGFYSG